MAKIQCCKRFHPVKYLQCYMYEDARQFIKQSKHLYCTSSGEPVINMSDYEVLITSSHDDRQQETLRREILS